MQSVRQIFFDLDGTLWPPESVVLPAFRQTFQQLGLPLPAEATLLKTLGYPVDEIWRMLLPGLPAAVRCRARSLMGEAELAILRSGGGAAFPGVRETLLRLREAGIQLYILSNCETDYLQLVPDALGLADCFDGRYCADQFPGLTKAEILQQILQRRPLPAAMVGDRFHDIEAGKLNNLFTVGCRFGHGDDAELAGADCVIDSFLQLTSIFGV
ncbi:MAG: HAD family hydrolase [Bacillota bacterium]|jgi:phosphoglycolate phosphatase